VLLEYKLLNFGGLVIRRPIGLSNDRLNTMESLYDVTLLCRILLSSQA